MLLVVEVFEKVRNREGFVGAPFCSLFYGVGLVLLCTLVLFSYVGGCTKASQFCWSLATQNRSHVTIVKLNLSSWSFVCRC